MILALARSPRGLVLSICVIVAAATIGWYATESVHPHCGVVVFSGKYTPLSELNSVNEKGKSGAAQKLADRNYQQAFSAGRCAPPRARWHEWLS